RRALPLAGQKAGRRSPNQEHRERVDKCCARSARPAGRNRNSGRGLRTHLNLEMAERFSRFLAPEGNKHPFPAESGWRPLQLDMSTRLVHASCKWFTHPVNEK